MEGEGNKSPSPAETLRAVILKEFSPNAGLSVGDPYGVDVETYQIVNFLKPQLAVFGYMNRMKAKDPNSGLARRLENSFNKTAEQWGFETAEKLGKAMNELKDSLKDKMTEKQWKDHFGQSNRK